MARPIEDDDGAGTSPSGEGSGGSTAPAATPAPGSKLGVVVTGTSYSFTADQIAAAGGPWASFRVRVTPLNSKGAGSAVEVGYARALPHRYWRLKYDSTKRGFCGCATLELRAKTGGPSVAVGGTAMTDSAPYAGYEGSKAFDGDSATAWASDNGGDHWVGYDFGAGGGAVIVEAGFIGRPDNSGYHFSDTDSPQTGGIEYSDDGTTWTRAFAITAPTTYPNGQITTFAPPG